MVLNNADNMMIGSLEIDRVYCGSVKVWERGGDIPEEVQVQITYLVNTYFSGTSQDDLYYMYGLYGSNADKPLLYAVAVFSDDELAGIKLDLGGVNNNYVSFSRQTGGQGRFTFSAPSTVGSDTSFPTGYGFQSSTSSLTSTFRTWTPSGSWGGMNPIVLYGNYPAEKISYLSNEFEVVYSSNI